ncbi:MAG TPA: elongation factor G [Rhodospirillales bacterium]|nr:elongation factor G [Rhodospirillaceae bacterium]HJP53586.1 elongation factor G [Rhodospirillales bacterium]
MTGKVPSEPRCAALVGPYLCGKTTLLESLLVASGSVHRKGSIKDGNTVGDGTPEARDRQRSTELSVASTRYLDEDWTFIDCPGSVELSQDTFNALMVADTAVVVCEPEVNKALTLSPVFRFLDEHNIPHFVFINKMDTAQTRIKAVIEALQAVSERPLILREVPIRDGERVSGHVDLASERAFRWNTGKPSDLVQVQLPEQVVERQQEARTEMLEALADFNDALLEELLEDIIPSTDDIYANLTKNLQEDLIVPVFFGSAESDNGIRRLWKALRHEAPEPSVTAKRWGLETSGEASAQVFKTLHGSQTGKLSLARVWSGEIADGMTVNGSRISGLFTLFGQKQDKLAKAGLGAVVALGRMDAVATGDALSPSGNAKGSDWPQPLPPLFSLAIHAENRADEVKLTGALAKLAEEDSSLSFQQNQDTNELLLWGQGEMHLQVALDRLKNRYNMLVTSDRPQVPYKETVRKSISQHARHKKQSGGHGQFGDVHLDIKPLPRGSGFDFNSTITGGVVPKQYIPAVENGVKDYMKRGPMGFQVVDIAVTLTDGQYHSVDSSDLAFKSAAQLAMRQGMPNCNPVLLEPIFMVKIAIPNEFTSKIQRLISGRRGQILGFDARPSRKNWDEVSVQLPQSEMHDLIIDLRSITLGVGTFVWEFDHLQEVTGKVADQVVSERAAAKK